MIELARARHAPVVASNFPAPLRQRVAKDGVDALAARPPEEKRNVPVQLLSDTPAS